MRVQLTDIATAFMAYLAVTRGTGAAPFGSSDPGSPCPPDATVVQNLFDKQLNYSYSPALIPVQKAWAGGDAPGACRALIDYYKASRNGWWLRFPKPSPGTGRAGGAADMALVDTYDFYTVTATVPRDADGGLNWDFKGPNDDVEYMYALSRHSAWASLAQAWNSTGNIIYYNMFSNLSADWVAHNPAPSHPDGTTWRSLEAGIRLDGTWPTAFYGMIDSYESTQDGDSKHGRKAPSPAPWRDDSWPVAMVASVGEHGSFLGQFCGDGNPNWRSMQYHGLANLAMLWPELNGAEEWLQKAFEGVVADAKTGVYPDGVESEETSSYHWVATENFLGLLETASYAGRGKDASVLALKQVAESMVNYTAYAIDFTGMAPMNGDNNEEFFGSDVYDQGEASRFNRPDWQYIASRGTKGTKPPGQPSAMFPWAGQFISRSGWGEAGPASLTAPTSRSHSSPANVVGVTSGPRAVTSDVWSFFDVGPFGSSSHGHNDKLHVSVRPFGLHMLTDSGRFAYTGNLSRWRSQYAVLTRAHNTIRVDDQDEQKGPAVATSPIPGSEWAIEADHDWARGSIGYDGVQGTAVHTRALWFSRSGGSLGRPYWVVVDRISSDRSRTLSALWHTHPNNTAALQPQTHSSESSSGSSAPMLRIDTQQDTTAHMVVVPAVSTHHTSSVATGSSWIAWSNATLIQGQQKPELQGWYSKEYDNVQESQATRYDGSCLGPSSSSSSGSSSSGGATAALGAGGQGSVANCTAAWLLLPWLDGGSGGMSNEPGASASILSETEGTVTVQVGAFGATETVVVPV